MSTQVTMMATRGDWEQQEMHRENSRRMDRAEASIERNQEILVRIDENTKGVPAMLKEHDLRLRTLERKWAWAAGAIAVIGGTFEYLFHYVFGHK